MDAVVFFGLGKTVHDTGGVANVTSVTKMTTDGFSSELGFGISNHCSARFTGNNSQVDEQSSVGILTYSRGVNFTVRLSLVSAVQNLHRMG